MFSFGIVKGLKHSRGIIWITRWAPWMVHAQEDCDYEDVAGDDGDVCALLHQVYIGLSMCDKCQLTYCTSCIDTHTALNLDSKGLSRLPYDEQGTPAHLGLDQKKKQIALTHTHTHM